ncbi:MAG: AAA family ATPase [Chloroflexi bacterium]|nr:AAA family ATPase [Chloroflexota bacterium]
MVTGGTPHTSNTPGGRLAQVLLDTVRLELFDVDEVIRLCLVAFYTDGHVLLEANPGMGKTQLVKALGNALALRWGRIQFTPDLMPADITGTFMPDPRGGGAGRLAFQPGPVFASVLLADEINRATPKTQSAMLEAMAERQVTVLGTTYLLPDYQQRRDDPTPRPFMVLATQNPIDQEGTYTLPEAQADRFTFKILMPLPGKATLAAIMGKEAGAAIHARGANGAGGGAGPRGRLTEADSRAWFARIQQEIRDVEALDRLETHIVNLIAATNRQFGELEGVEGDDRRWLEEVLPELLPYGLGPRAAIALMRGAKAWTYLFSADTPRADGPALARVVIPTLRHRIRLTYDWKERFVGVGGAREAEQWSAPGAEAELLSRLIAELCQRTAPTSRASGGPEYQRSVAAALRVVVEQRAC